MNKTYKLVKEIVESWNYMVVEENGEYIIIRYQLNAIHICPNEEDESFVSVLLTHIDEITEDNYLEVIMRCHKLNEKMKQIKFYALSNIITAAAEFFYHEKEDLAFQMKRSLSNLIAAKVAYKNYGN